MKDIETTEKVATPSSKQVPQFSSDNERGTYITRNDYLDLGKSSANAMIEQLIDLAKTLDTFTARCSKFSRHPFSVLHDAIFDLSDELPFLGLPSLDAVAVLGASVFGERTVPDVTDRDRAIRVSLAFRVAYTILNSEGEGGGNLDSFFIACAVAALRKTDKERAKQKKRLRKAKQRQEKGAASDES